MSGNKRPQTPVSPVAQTYSLLSTIASENEGDVARIWAFIHELKHDDNLFADYTAEKKLTAVRMEQLLAVAQKRYPYKAPRGKEPQGKVSVDVDDDDADGGGAAAAASSLGAQAPATASARSTSTRTATPHASMTQTKKKNKNKNTNATHPSAESQASADVVSAETTALESDRALATALDEADAIGSSVANADATASEEDADDADEDEGGDWMLAKLHRLRRPTPPPKAADDAPASADATVPLATPAPATRNSTTSATTGSMPVAPKPAPVAATATTCPSGYHNPTGDDDSERSEPRADPDGFQRFRRQLAPHALKYTAEHISTSGMVDCAQALDDVFAGADEGGKSYDEVAAFALHRLVNSAVPVLLDVDAAGTTMETERRWDDAGASESFRATDPYMADFLKLWASTPKNHPEYLNMTGEQWSAVANLLRIQRDLFCAFYYLGQIVPNMAEDEVVHGKGMEHIARAVVRIHLDMTRAGMPQGVSIPKLRALQKPSPLAETRGFNEMLAARDQIVKAEVDRQTQKASMDELVQQEKDKRAGVTRIIEKQPAKKPAAAQAQTSRQAKKDARGQRQRNNNNNNNNQDSVQPAKAAQLQQPAAQADASARPHAAASGAQAAPKTATSKAPSKKQPN
jgi:hypothetical protein